MELTLTQCKQLNANYSDLREVVRQMEDQPEWIEDGLSVADIQAIQQGGCDSGAYMPAVTYRRAASTMSEHGDDVLDYIEQALGEVPKPHEGFSWDGLAVFYLSRAVELWAYQFDLDGVDWD